MAEDDEIRELIGRMGAARRQGFHVSPGATRIVLAALRFYLAARTWLATTPADPHDDPSRRRTEKYVGPAATIADMRRQGLVALTITCDGTNCWNTRRIAFDALMLPETTLIPDIAGVRRFRCSVCGNRQVRVAPDWTDHVAQGNGRARTPETAVE